MEGFVHFFQRVWLSRFPKELSYAICVAVVFELLVWLINRRIRAALHPSMQAFRHPDPVVRARRSRLLLRPPMAINRCVLYAVAIAMVLRIFGLNLRGEIFPLLGAAFVAALVAAWPTLQDAFRGYLLILHDVWATGDRVRVGSLEGTVETMGLTHTRLRALDGSLLVIANGRVREVMNLSRATKPGQAQAE